MLAPPQLPVETIQRNRDQLGGMITTDRSTMPAEAMDDARPQELLMWLSDKVSESRIDLNELFTEEDAEYNELRGKLDRIIRQILDESEAIQNNEKYDRLIAAWYVQFKGVSDAASAHNRELSDRASRGILHALKEAGPFNPEAPILGSDHDISNSLPCVNPSDITASGTYILPPQDLDHLQALFADVQNQAEGIYGEIKILVPLAHEGHWRLVSAVHEDSMWTQPSVWDPLSEPETLSPYVMAVRQSIRTYTGVETTLAFGGVQGGLPFCADHVIKKALVEQGGHEVDPVVTATTDRDLRKAIATKIADKKGLSVPQFTISAPEIARKSKPIESSKIIQLNREIVSKICAGTPVTEEAYVKSNRLINDALDNNKISEEEVDRMIKDLVDSAENQDEYDRKSQEIEGKIAAYKSLPSLP